MTRVAQAVRTITALALASVLACSGLAGAARADAGPRIGMRLLVISAEGTEPIFDAWTSELDNEGIPYDTLIASTTPLTSDTLQDGPDALYQGIVLATDDLAYFDGTQWTSAFDSNEWSTLRTYEQTFGIRQVDAYSFPKPSIGLNYPKFAGNLNGIVAVLTALGAPVFPYLVREVPIQNAWGYLADALLADPIDPSTYQNLVQAPTGEPLVGIYTHPDGRLEMVNTLDGAAYLLHTKLLLHGQIAWVTNGTYLGISRNFLTMHIDDVFLPNDRWDVLTHQTVLDGSIRMAAADVDYARDWSLANAFRIDMGFNAAGAGSDALTQRLLANKQHFWWWNHTYTHADLDASPTQEIVDEIRTNITWAQQNGIANFNVGDLVTGGHSGLDNPNMPSGLSQAGISTIGSDNSINDTSYFIGSARTAPRYPTNIYYDTSTRAQNLDEFNWRYFFNCVVGCFPAALTWAQLVDMESSTWLSHALGNDPRIHYVHQSNLTGDRVLYDVLNATLSKYRQYVKPAFQQLSVAQSGQAFARTGAWRAAWEPDAASGYIQDGVVHLTSSSTVDVPISGTASGDVYGGERSGWMTLQAGQTVTLPALGARAADTPPVAQSLTLTVAEDTPAAVTLPGTDAEGDLLTWAIVSQPAHGTLSGTAPQLTYTPALDYNGPDSFTFKANDLVFDSNVATATITVTAVNDAPMADPKTISDAHPGRASGVVLSASDVDSPSLAFSVVSPPAHGTLGAISGTSCAQAGGGSSCTSQTTYTPAAGYLGADSFTYRASDASLASPAVAVSVTSVNAAPVAQNGSVSAVEDTPAAVGLTATDADGDALTYTVVSQPAHGTLSGAAPSLTYMPSTDYNGPDSFVFRASDGMASSGDATESITVGAVNDAPVADAKSETLTSSRTTITLSGSDADSAALTFSISTPPGHGSLSGVYGTSCAAQDAGSTCTAKVDYTAARKYYGPDSFAYSVSDGAATSNATVSITVTNSPPSAADQSVSTPEDTAKAVTLSAADPDGDELSYVIVSAPVQGTLGGSAPALTYTPDADYAGPDAFTYYASDGTNTSNTATVTIDVTPVNDEPSAAPKSLPAHWGDPNDVTLTGTDVDSSSMTFSITGQPTHGSLGAITGTSCIASGGGSSCSAQVSYTPDAGYTGTDSFTYRASDGAAQSAAATVAVTVGNHVPVATGSSVSTSEDTAVSTPLQAGDGDGDALTYIIVTAPSRGTLSGSAPALTYTPAPNANGADSFSFVVSDGVNTSDAATVSISVAAVNDRPAADPKTLANAHQNTGRTVTLSGSDVDSSSLTFDVTVQPANGALSALGAVSCSPAAVGWSCTAPVTYTARAGYVGTDSFKYTLADGALTSTAATVSITVVNSAPVASNQSANAYLDSPASVALGATDADADVLTFSVLTQPAHGTLTGTAPYLTYTPALGYSGPDGFTFRASDGVTSSNTGTVSMTVLPRRIVFVSDRTGSVRHIFSMQPDGTSVQQLTTGSATDQEPALSKDGKRIVFSSNRPGNYEIYKMNTDGTGLVRLTSKSAADTTPSWSPDGTKIAFASKRSGGGDIYVMNADGRSVKKLTSSGDVESQPSWSPDGKKIVYTRKDDIWTMTSSGGSQTKLYGSSAADTQPHWSVDGTRIVFTTAKDGNNEIYAMTSSGSGLVRLTSGSADDSKPSWAPDGSKIAFTSLRDGQYEIYVMNPDGSSQTRLTSATGQDVQPSW